MSSLAALLLLLNRVDLVTFFISRKVEFGIFLQEDIALPDVACTLSYQYLAETGGGIR